MVALGFIRLCLSTDPGPCSLCSWCIKPGHPANSSWAMTRKLTAKWILCTQAHHRSPSHDQQPLPDRAPSSSGTWWWTSFHRLQPPCSHCGWVRMGPCRPYSGLGPGFVGSAWSETLKPKKHHTFWSVSYSCWVILVPRCPCGGYPQPWPSHSTAGPREHRRSTWGGDWT